MQIRRKTILVAAILGVCMWVVDAALDASFYYEGSFIELFILDVPPHKIYIRMAIAIILLVSALIIGRMGAELQDQLDRIAHLNSVLRATRDINQLISTQQDPGELLSRTCATLTAARGYRTAWVALMNESASVQVYADQLEDLREALQSHLVENRPLPCMRRAAEDGVVTIPTGSEECSCCPLFGECADNAAIVAPLDHVEERFGFLGLSLADAVEPSDQDRTLAGDVAHDIAFGLHNIQVEQALQGSEEQHRAIFENTGTATTLLDEDGTIILANQRFADLAGYTREQIQGKMDYTDFIAPHDRDRMTQYHGQRRQPNGHPPHQYEFDFKNSDGETRRMLLTVGMIPGTRTSVASALDITERKRAEESRREHAEIIRQAHDLISITDPQGRITYVNEAKAQMLGIPAEELVGAHINTFGEDPERGATQEEILANTLRHGSWRGEVVNYTTDGEARILDCRTLTLCDSDGEVVSVVGISRDITERKKAEEALREREQRLQLALQGAELGTWDWDMRTDEVRFNRRWAEMKGYDLQELEPHLSTWEHLVHPDDRARVCNALNAHLQGQTELYEAEFRMKHKSGGWVWIHDKGKVIDTDEEGNPVRACGTHLDITETKETEQALRRLNQELEERVENRTAELRAANEELEAFTYSVSHDLRAPLRAMDGFSDILLQEYGSRLNEKGRDHLRRISAASQRMGNLIDDLLKLSRVAQADMTRQTVDLSGIAREIIRQIQTIEPGRETQITIQEHLTATGDEILIGTLLQNLLDNAWKFTSREPVTQIEFGRVTVDGTEAFYVRDNGVGFDMKYVENLFGAFQRLHSREEFPGTGIGLATVQRITNRHGGRVWADAEVDEGATFYFTLRPG